MSSPKESEHSSQPDGSRPGPWYATHKGEVNKIVFNNCPEPTLGMELELQIIDPETRQLVSGGPAILSDFPGADWVKPELLQSTVEMNVGPCNDIGEARESLNERLALIQASADKHGYGLVSAGTHPSSRWESQEITEEDRYQEMLDRMQWPVRRLMIFGLHVHVGVSSGEKAIAISNSLATFLPHLLALSASSPFWHGEDTGLASVRVKIFESLPSAGLPYRMINWGEFQRFMNTLTHAGAITSIREVWWDIRPHPVFGTIEIRIADALPTIKENLALAALIQCLVVRLGELYDNGEVLPVRRYWVVAENKWRAARFGQDAQIICDDAGTIDGLEAQTLALVESLEPVAKRLRCHSELVAIREMLEVGASFRRQRAVFAKNGNMSDVVDSLAHELRADDILHSI